MKIKPENMKSLIVLMLAVVASSSFGQLSNKNTGQKSTREAEFPGGTTAWLRYIDNNLNTPMLDTLTDVNRLNSLTVQVKFMIEKDGTVTAVTVSDAKKKYPLLIAEAIRVVSNSPKWLPALKNGKAVRSYKKQAITICLSDE